jgi:hypothetical protein
MDVVPVGRFFLCAREDCRARVLVCSPCDHGQIYCGKECSNLARLRTLRDAGRRYQSGRAGRHKHAERMRCYRARREKVTHQGSPSPPADALLVMSPAPCANAGAAHPACAIVAGTAWHCRFCGRKCSEFVRSGFLMGRRAAPRAGRRGRERRRGDDDGHSP